VSYGAKFCDLHVATAQFSPPAVTWINSVRKCLQVELVPLLRLCRRPPTCEEIRKTAFQSHQPCYFNPYGGFSVCKVTSIMLPTYECRHSVVDINQLTCFSSFSFFILLVFFKFYLFNINLLKYCMKDCIQKMYPILYITVALSVCL